MALGEDLERGFNLGYKSSRFAPLGDAIKSTIAAYNQQNQLESGLAAKYGMERLFQDPLERQLRQGQVGALASEEKLRQAKINVLSRQQGGGGSEGQGAATTQSPFAQSGIPQGEEEYYYPPEPVTGTIDGISYETGKYKKPEPTERGKLFYEQQKKSQEPLTGDTAVKYQSSIRAINSIKNIQKELGDLDNFKEQKDLVWKSNAYINGATSKDTWIPGVEGAYSSYYKSRAGDKGAQIGNYFLNLAESIIRAESGAAVTDSEMLRTKARSLFDAWRSSPETWNEQSKMNLDFAKGIAKQIRPLSKSEWGYDLERVGKNPLSKKQSFDTEEEAEASGYKGEAFIAGRRVRID